MPTQMQHKVFSQEIVWPTRLFREKNQQQSGVFFGLNDVDKREIAMEDLVKNKGGKFRLVVLHDFEKSYKNS